MGISDALTASLDAWNRIRDRNQDIVLVNHLLSLIACSTNRVPMGDEGQVTHESGFTHILVLNSAGASLVSFGIQLDHRIRGEERLTLLGKNGCCIA